MSPTKSTTTVGAITSYYWAITSY